MDNSANFFSPWENKRISPLYKKDEEDKKGRLLRQERYAGSCSRSFYVGDVKPEDVKAKYESGVLSVLVPKEDIKKSPVSTAIPIE